MNANISNIAASTTARKVVGSLGVIGAAAAVVVAVGVGGAALTARMRSSAVATRSKSARTGMRAVSASGGAPLS